MSYPSYTCSYSNPPYPPCTTQIYGTTGAQGFTGAQGSQGNPAPSTNTGATGAQGAQGFTGETGAQGFTGAQGAQGFTGAMGAQGNPAPSTNTGATGAQGFTGAQGNPGTAVDTGATGAQGFTGATGAQGFTGAQGNPGSGSVNIVDNNTDSTFYPLFVGGTGTAVSTLNIDSLAPPFSVNPSNGNITLATTLKIDGNKTALGLGAGQFSQGAGSVAIGQSAGNTGQGAQSIAIGEDSGKIAQATTAIAVGFAAGETDQKQAAVAIGYSAGQTTQGTSAVAIGSQAGATDQKSNAVAIGISAGTTTQGLSAVAIGESAGKNIQGAGSVAIGKNAAGSGFFSQAADSVAIGNGAGEIAQATGSVAVGAYAGNDTQGTGAVAIGAGAGRGLVLAQGSSAVAIGNLAGSSVAASNSIILNGSGSDLSATTEGFFVKPVRNVSQTNVLFYDASGGEITYDTTFSTQLLPPSYVKTDVLSQLLSWTNDPATLIPGNALYICSTSNGIMRASSIFLTKGMVISNIIYNQLSAEGTDTAFVGLYDINGNRLALSNSFDTAVAEYKKIPLISPYTVLTTGLYFTTLLFNNAGTTPTVLGVVGSGVNIGTQTPYSGTAPIYLRSFFVTVSSFPLPAIIPAAGVTPFSTFIWMAVS